MIVRNYRLAALFVLLGTAACEQENQTLPFDAVDVVTRTIPSSGGSVSTSAGAAVNFPSASLPAATEVSVQVTEPTAATEQLGNSVSPSFQVEPAGLQLAAPATAELNFQSADADRAWLTTVVAEVGGVATPVGDSRVDLSTGIASGRVDRLGTYTAVIPPESAVYPVVTGGASLSLSPSPSAGPIASIEALPDSLVSPNCVHTCGVIRFYVTENIARQVKEAAVIFPVVKGGFVIRGDSVSGTLYAGAILRIALQSGQTSESIPIQAKIEATGESAVTRISNGYRVSNVLRTISQSAARFDESVGDAADVASIDFVVMGAELIVRIERTFRIRNTDGELEDAAVRIDLPFKY